MEGNDMKVLALNSSARVGVMSKTEMLLSALVEGLTEGGAEVETINLKDKKINYCIGCYTCWTKTPGVCVFKDDMTKELYPKYMAADMAVIASPLYHFTLNAHMKTFIERTLPLLEPFLIDAGNGRTLHPLRDNKHPAMVFLSVAGFPEDSVFDQLSSWVNFIYKQGLLAEIYRAGAENLVNPATAALKERVLGAVKDAGRELAEKMAVSPDTLARIKEPMPSKEKMFAVANDFWQTCIDEGVTPKEFEEKGMMLRPTSINTYLTLMEMGFNAAAAADASAVIQFNFTGQAQGTGHLKIAGGAIETAETSAEKPDLTINTPFELWLDIMTGKADGQAAFMEQKYTAEGDLNLLINFGSFFGR